MLLWQIVFASVHYRWQFNNNKHGIGTILT